jgi:hypothetical protein
MRSLQGLVGESVIIDYSIEVDFCNCWSKLGLELFTIFMTRICRSFLTTSRLSRMPTSGGYMPLQALAFRR